jgi:hypothetical protein
MALLYASMNLAPKAGREDETTTHQHSTPAAGQSENRQGNTGSLCGGAIGLLTLRTMCGSTNVRLNEPGGWHPARGCTDMHKGARLPHVCDTKVCCPLLFFAP